MASCGLRTCHDRWLGIEPDPRDAVRPFPSDIRAACADAGILEGEEDVSGTRAGIPHLAEKLLAAADQRVGVAAAVDIPVILGALPLECPQRL